MLKKIVGIKVVLTALLICSSYSIGSSSTWTEEQEKVWSSVEYYVGLLEKGQVDEFLKYYHSDFSGWVPQIGYLPDDKTSRSKFVRHFLEPNEEGKTESGEVLLGIKKPISINLFGDVAIVHYIQEEIRTTDGEDRIREVWAWTDILKQVGGKWVMIGDHGQILDSK